MGTFMSDYIVIVCTSGVLNVVLALMAYYRRSDFLGTKAFIMIAVTSAVYIFGYAVELSSKSLAEINFWTKVEYLGMPFIAPANLVMILQFLGLEKVLTRAVKSLLIAIPSITAVLVATNDLHHWFYRDIYLRPGAPSPVADITIGPWYLIHGSFTFGCLCAGACIILAKWNAMKHNYRLQMIILFIGTMLPATAAFIYLMGLTPYGMDPVPVILCITTALYIWAIWSRGMLGAAPLARESLFENMFDGVLIVNISGKLIDFNPAVWSLTGNFSPASIGQPILELIEPVSEEAANFIRSSDPAVQSEQKVTWNNKGFTCHYLLRSSPVLKRDGHFIGRIIQLIDMTEQIQLQERLQIMATIDSLTQILNRGYFMEKSRETLEFSRKRNESVSFILFDVDHFKKINDRFGHDYGDAALRHIVEICRRHLKTTDLFGRYGGEEFVLCIPGTPLEEAGILADSIRKDIAETPLNSRFGLITITSSFGVVESGGEEGTLEELLSQADTALYASKNGGRNRVHLTRSSPMRMFWQI